MLGSEFSECRRTHTLFEYPLGKPLEAKLLKEHGDNRGQNHQHSELTTLLEERWLQIDAACLYLVQYRNSIGLSYCSRPHTVGRPDKNNTISFSGRRAVSLTQGFSAARSQ